MPLIGSTAYSQVSQITSLARSLLNDAQGNWATDAVLLPYVNSIYRTTQRKIADAGGAEFVTDGPEEFVIKAVAVPDPGTTVVLNDAGVPPNQLPANLLLPLKLWERPNLSTQEFVEMTDLTQHGGLPSRLQGATLGVWEFKTDGIYFIGATQDTQIRLRYTAALPDLAGPTDIILIRGAQECLAQGAAALTGLARGSPLAEKMDDLYKDSVEDVIQMNVRAQQNAGVRRRPFRSSRRAGRYGLGDWNW